MKPAPRKHSKVNKWYVGVKKDGQFHYVGIFGDEETAARAYDRKAIELYGEFARTNSPGIRLLTTPEGATAMATKVTYETLYAYDADAAWYKKWGLKFLESIDLGHNLHRTGEAVASFNNGLTSLVLAPLAFLAFIAFGSVTTTLTSTHRGMQWDRFACR